VRRREAHWKTHCNIVLRPRAHTKAHRMAATRTIQSNPPTCSSHGVLMMGPKEEGVGDSA